MSARSKFDGKAEPLIAALLTESSHAAAAAKVGLSEATVQRWLKDPAFLDQYRVARRRCVEGAVGRLQQAAGEAVDTLRRNLSCGAPAAELRAAATVLEYSVRGLEIADLLERVEHLERLVRGEGDEVEEPGGQTLEDGEEDTPAGAVTAEMPEAGRGGL
jgi:hypothetical protein